MRGGAEPSCLLDFWTQQILRDCEVSTGRGRSCDTLPVLCCAVLCCGDNPIVVAAALPSRCNLSCTKLWDCR
jgi:hypothetical protein